MSLIEALLTIIVLGVGTARISALIVIDEITEPLRDLIFHYFPPEDNDAKGWFYQSLRKATDEERWRQDGWETSWWAKRFTGVTQGQSPRKPTFLGKLLGCHKCVAVWVAVANLIALHVWRDGTLLFNVFMAQAFVSAALNHRYYR